MMEGRCDCGACSFTLSEAPQWLVDCNCGYCSRIQALWANLPLDKVRLSYNPEKVLKYARADHIMDFVICAQCGCCTHWEHRDPETYGRLSVNCAMMAHGTLADIPIRHFDGKDTGAYIDDTFGRHTFHRG